MQLPDFPDRFIPDSATSDGVSPVEEEGVILQRGGEALRLEKSTDRMTVALNGHLVPNDGAEGVAEDVAKTVGADVVRVMASVELIELQVNPDQLDQVMQSIRQEKDVRFVSHVYQLQKSLDTPIYLTNQITVQFAASVTADRMKTIAATHGIEVFKLVPGVSKAFVFIVTPQAAANPIKLANRLLRSPDILMAEPNIVVQVQRFNHPGNKVVSQDGQDQERQNQEEQNQEDQQWHLHHNGGEDLALGSHVAAKAAWEITQGTRSIVVAIVDDAIDVSYPAFLGEGKIVAPVEFGSGGQRHQPGIQPKTKEPGDAAELTAEASIATPPLSMHGTLCAGIAVAEETPSGKIGVAPGCALMPIAIDEYLDDQLIEQVCEWALDKGAAVLNLGWGVKATYFPLSLRQQAAITRVATQGRNGKGCVVVVAAGNSNRPLNGVVEEGQPEPGMDQVGGETYWLNGLAVHPDVVTVAAITSLNRKAAYSNWGAGISVCAPSDNYSPDSPSDTNTKWLGRKIVSIAPFPNSSEIESEVDQGMRWGGTSAAGAIVSGVAALVLSVHPDLTAHEVKQLLQQTADKLIDSEPDPQLGLQHGVYNARGYSQWFGYGKVNAFRAVQAAHEMAQQTIKRLGASTRSIKKQNPQIVEIPDYDSQGITSAIDIEETGVLRSIEISVDVEHSFMGDLELALISPKGMPILLQGRSSGRSTVLRKTYSLQTTPLLKTLLHQPVSGSWQLKLVDHVPLNTGQLKSWTLHLGL